MPSYDDSVRSFVIDSHRRARRKRGIAAMWICSTFMLVLAASIGERFGMGWMFAYLGIVLVACVAVMVGKR